jgi:7-carboxy-7-deazaguanine synthase
VKASETADPPDRLVVSEIFGPTVQGEGASAGRRCAFLRLGGCNLSCRWCDTPYTWDWAGIGQSGVAYQPRTELRTLGSGEVLARLLAYDVDTIVISGGEPLSQQRRLVPLVRSLLTAGRRLEFETNGTRVPVPDIVRDGVRFNVSPKLAHSGDPAHRRIVPQVLRALAALPDVTFKFVCRSPADLDEVAAIEESYGTRPVWIMPEGQTVAELNERLASLADAVVARGWNLTTRLHVVAWGGRRGV